MYYMWYEKLTLAGHWVTPGTPSRKLVWNWRIPCQWKEVPLRFVKLLCTVTPVYCQRLSTAEKLKERTNSVTPISLNSRTRKLSIDNCDIGQIAIRCNGVFRDGKIILSRRCQSCWFSLFFVRGQTYFNKLSRGNLIFIISVDVESIFPTCAVLGRMSAALGTKEALKQQKGVVEQPRCGGLLQEGPHTVCL